MRFLLILLTFALPAQADTLDKRTQDFVSANTIAIFYHEFGHALIDIMGLPIFGQEEDAADVLSAVLIHDFFDEKTAQEIARATAVGFLGDQTISEAERDRVAYWDVHGPDLQRYYTFVCLIYGANPRARARLADRLELPEGRRDTCPEEFRQAEGAWGPVVHGLMEKGGGRSIRILADHKTNEAGKLATEVLTREVAAMNRDLTLPTKLLVRVEPCKTVNAFYDGSTREIIMCTEFAEYLADIVDRW